MPPPPGRIGSPVAPKVGGAACSDTSCSGTIAADGYCNTCGLQPSESTSAAPGSPSATTAIPDSGMAAASIAVPTAPRISARVASTAGGSTRRTRSTTSARTELGAGLVQIAPTTVGDPTSAVMDAEEIQAVLGEKPEEERFCSACGQPVGRGHDHEPGRITGFCGNCRTPFNFHTNTPTLAAGEIVGGQYRILGPIAHGGMGWIYLGQDTAVSNRWVVLKGLLNQDDADAVASAVAERQFLARIEHGSIVNIYNFVTWKGAGYIVMEYVGGESLNAKLKARRVAAGGVPDPLPLAEAIAYILGVLPAIGYLHESGLVYNDLKPANMMAVGDTVKLIDVGGVMQANDHDAAIFGTQGFQGPEVASMGPSVSSDLYTVGRTLAVLTLNFVFHTGPYQYGLPTPENEPLFNQWESYYRFLLKATAEHPDDRFQTADEMAEQLLGILREVVAISRNSPRPTTSTRFSGDRLAAVMLSDDSVVEADWRALPLPKVNSDAEGAAFLVDLPDISPVDTISLIDEAIRSGSAPDSPEVRLRRAREFIEMRHDPTNVLRAVEHVDPWDWRVSWYRSVAALVSGDAVTAAEGFSRVWTELPGEIAPKLAVALAAELAGEYDRAAQLYAQVIALDSSFVSAAFGLARCRASSGDRAGAVAAYRAVPASSAAFTDAQVASARVLASTSRSVGAPSANHLADAARTIETARIDNAERSILAIEMLEQAHAAVLAGELPEDAKAQVFGNPLTEEGLRQSLERAYRDMGRVVATAEERFAWVDKANAIRVPSLL